MEQRKVLQNKLNKIFKNFKTLIAHPLEYNLLKFGLFQWHRIEAPQNLTDQLNETRKGQT